MIRAVRADRQVQELCSAAIRALAGNPAMQLRGGRLFHGAVAAPAAPPHLRPSSDDDDLRSLRGAADGLALRELRTDRRIHAAHAPADVNAKRLFDLLEQYRVESLVPEEYEGVRHNLRHRHEAWAETFVKEDLLQTEQGMLVYTVAQVCRSRVNAVPLDAHLEDKLEPARIALAPRIGADVALLRALRHDQAGYAAAAARLASRIAEMLDSAESDAANRRDERAVARRRSPLLWPGEQFELEQAFPVAGRGESRLLEEGGSAYRVFTRSYDVEREAAALVRPALLRTLREELDESVARAGINFGRLARHLQALFARPAEDGWNGAEEEGRIDGRMLSQLVASPTERRLFKQVRREPVADCAVSFLLDCSGSMKKHAPRLALLVDSIVRALEQAGIGCEVLGFTTGAWNGGRARRDWMRAGSPPHPGRLNEVSHLVFKSADEGWRRRRRSIAALLKTDLYREGVDGEAVEWACRRLRGRPERRRILMVVSDGSPMDGATSLANDAHYLDHHLQQVVSAQSTLGDIEIMGLGVGLDLGPYYAKSLVIDLAQPVSLRTFLDVADLLASHSRRSR